VEIKEIEAHACSRNDTHHPHPATFKAESERNQKIEAKDARLASRDH
jgi:hypothetical protein